MEACPSDKGSSWNDATMGHEMEGEKPEDTLECKCKLVNKYKQIF